MTVAELIEALSNISRPADVMVDCRVEGQPDGDWGIERLDELVITQGPNAGSWVTLVLENAR